MSGMLGLFTSLVGENVVDQLLLLSKALAGKRIVHVNSTALGGGVAEILGPMTALLNELGLQTQWRIINGTNPFFECTKMFHNALQGNKAITVPRPLQQEYEQVVAENSAHLKEELADADFVFIHDPQPLPLITHVPNRRGKWIWRCHIDVSEPNRRVWSYLEQYVKMYDASIFSLPDFAQNLPHPMYIIPPSINPFNDKNRDLSLEEIAQVRPRFGIDNERPLLLQVSRFDKFKDPWGVVEAFQLAKSFRPDLQLALAGGGASDDPEGEVILRDLQSISQDNADIHIISLPPDAHLTINALQRSADIIIQKSVKEGFGLTVTEGLWKSKGMIGGNTGGIRIQVVNHHTGFLVNTPEGAASKIRYFLQYPEMARQMGEMGHQYVKENFLLTRHVREYLSLMVTLLDSRANNVRVEL